MRVWCGCHAFAALHRRANATPRRLGRLGQVERLGWLERCEASGLELELIRALWVEGRAEEQHRDQTEGRGGGGRRSDCTPGRTEGCSSAEEGSSWGGSCYEVVLSLLRHSDSLTEMAAFVSDKA